MQPIAFHIGSFAIYWYGVLLAVSVVVGLWTAGRRGMREGIPSEKIMDLGPWLIVGAIVGARTVFVITYWKEQFAGKPLWEIVMLRHGGLVFYGGMIGATLAYIVATRLKKLPLWKVADILAPSVALGYAFGRMGCLMNGCCYGRACELPWAIHYPATHETYPNGVHPSQIYDSLLNLGLYAALAWWYRRKTFDGQIFAGYLMGYAVTRSVVELFRGDYSAAHRYGGLTPGHLFSIGVFAAGVVLYLVLRRVKPAEKRNAD